MDKEKNIQRTMRMSNLILWRIIKTKNKTMIYKAVIENVMQWSRNMDDEHTSEVVVSNRDGLLANSS